MRAAHGMALLIAAQLAACSPGPAQDALPGDNGAGREIVKVTGELRSSNSRFFGPPSISNIWKYTISFMAPDGSRVPAGRQILAFDTQELMIKIRDKNNKLNQKQKELQKQEILAREVLAESRLAIEEARALVDKAALKADIPESLLAGREYREYRLVLRQSKLTLALRKSELEKEIRVQETESEILRREIAVLDAEVALLQSSIDSMTIMAPGDGVVIHVISRHGNKVAVGDNVWGGRRVLEFPDLSQLELYLEIPERESARITMGQTVSFTLDAAPDRPFEGKVVELASVIHTKSTNQPAKVFDAIIALQNPDPELMRPGMSVNAEIQLDRDRETGT
ncbi:MAG: efflux RND transporter periplasmic adaptor subunit [Xanthomonadales bacterium]